MRIIDRIGVEQMFAMRIKKRIFSRNVLVWLLVIAVTTAMGFGIAEPNMAPSTSSANNDGQLLKGSLNEPVQSINFEKNWSVKTALQFLAAEYRKNIVPSSKVEGTLAVAQLYDVTFTEAMNAVLGNQFVAVEKG
ncbi:MAG: hypothetical protein GWO86_01215, partial [Planctomycetes bacterium]|nr:hypothetical protein [Planctomycetota bacterium]